MSDIAEIEVFCPGMLSVLSVGKGDIKLVVGGDDPEEIEKSKRLIEKMLHDGYSIFVETDSGPERVRQFNPHRMTYIVADVPDDNALPPGPEPQRALPPGPRPKARRRTKEVPVSGSRATAVGRTAGG